LSSFAQQRFHRRALLGSLGLTAVGAAIGGPVLAARLADAAAHKPVPPKPANLWVPAIHDDGLKIFESVEDDRAHSHPGVKHIYPAGDAIRFDMHLCDRDSSRDRQRNEAVGMRQNGALLKMLPGQTWKLAWDLYIPAALRATNSFTHIHQLKMPGSGSAPIFVMSLRLSRGKPTIETQVAYKGIHVGDTPLEPLHDKWIRTEFEYGIGNSGHVRWTLKDGAQTVLDVTRTNVDLFIDDRTRPKWGIYRSLRDPANLRDCYLLIRNVSGSAV
jgi:chitin-binding protein